MRWQRARKFAATLLFVVVALLIVYLISDRDKAAILTKCRLQHQGERIETCMRAAGYVPNTSRMCLTVTGNRSWQETAECYSSRFSLF
jgi:hypothetical protein